MKKESQTRAADTSAPAELISVADATEQFPWTSGWLLAKLADTGAVGTFHRGRQTLVNLADLLAWWESGRKVDDPADYYDAVRVFRVADEIHVFRGIDFHVSFGRQQARDVAAAIEEIA